LAFQTVSEAFERLLQRIELNPARAALASQRYNAVKSTIEAALPGKTVRQIGSFQRKTKIRPSDLSDTLDVDAVVAFKRFTTYATDGSGTTPSSALDLVRSALVSDKTYRVMTPVKDHPVVTLQYADAMKMEITPAFIDGTGNHPRPPGVPECYVVGRASGTWEPADYDYDAAMISTLNAQSNNKLVPTIKLAKAYFRNKDLPLRSFHVELLAANTAPQIIAEWDAKGHKYGYQYVLAEFLRRVSSKVTQPAQLPNSYSPAVDSNLNGAYLAKLSPWLAARGDEAWKLCEIQSVSQAVASWRSFFGEPFPS
jgi:Second Messenger Oligonucleotide or Dinucleotide Synthetase domain